MNQPDNKPFKVTWSEAGRLGIYRIRKVWYTAAAGSVFATLLIAESRDDKFIPLMKWLGQMPSAAIYRGHGIDVLAISKNFGGNIPMVQTWAWISGNQGPVRLDLPAAAKKAIEKVAPGYSGYETGLDWSTLRYQTWVWKGEWPGKTGVSDSVQAWFKLGPEGLEVKQVEFRQRFNDSARIVRWPR